MKSIAPRYIISIANSGDARIIGEGVGINFGIVGLKVDSTIIDIPGNTIRALPKVEISIARSVVATKYADEFPAIRHDGTIEDAIRLRNSISRNHRISRIPPNDVVLILCWFILPWNIRERLANDFYAHIFCAIDFVCAVKSTRRGQASRRVTKD